MPSETSTPLSAKLMFRTFSFSRNPSLLIFPFCWMRMLTIDLARGWQGFSRRGVNLSQDEKEANDESSGIEANFSPGSKIDFFLQIQHCKLFMGFKMQKRPRCKSDSFLKPMEILGKRNGNSYKKKWKFLKKEMEKNGIIVFAKESLRSCLRPIVSMVSLLLDDQILSFLAIRHNSIAQRGFQSSLVFFHSMSATILF